MRTSACGKRCPTDNPWHPEMPENTGFFHSGERENTGPALHLRWAIGRAVEMGGRNAEIVLAPETAQGRFRRFSGMTWEVVKRVIFSQADFDLLCLLRWSRHLLPETVEGLFSQRDVENLMALGLMKLHQRSGSFVLTAKGNRLVSEVLPQSAPDTPPSYRPSETARRIRLSRLAVTAYRAHIQIFTTRPDELSDSPTLFLPAVSRGKGHNPWGNSRIAALAHLGDLLCDVHYVCPGIGKLSLTDELTAFNNHAARFQGARRTFLFAGESYNEVLAELMDSAGESPDSKLIRYADAYRSLNLPVHLLSCDDTGAMQLQIMSVPNYRERLTRATLKAHYRPPPEDTPTWDAVFDGTPFVLAADMNLRRMDAALRSAEEHGHSKVAMALLRGQGEALLVDRYQGSAAFYALTDDTLAEFLGRPPTPHTPKRTQFLTEKGEVVDAPFIKAVGKAGGSPDGAMEAMV